MTEAGDTLGLEARIGLFAVNCSSARFIHAIFIMLLVSKRFSLRIVVSFVAIFIVSILSAIVSKSK